MSTALDATLVPRVKEIVDEYGKSVTITTLASQTHDPTDGTVTEGSATNHTVIVTPPEPYSSRYIDGELVRVGDCRIYLPALDLAFTPVEGLKVTIDSEIWKIMRVGKIFTGYDVALYDLQLRS